MYKTLRKMSFHAILPGFITVLVAALAALVVVAPCLFSLLSGTSGLDSSVKSGQMVEFDSMMVVAAFATVSNANGDTINTYYIIDLGDDQYMAMEAKPRYDSLLESALIQSERYYHTHATDTLEPMGEISGAVSDMDSETWDFLRQGLDSADFGGEIVPYIVTLGNIGYLPQTAFVIILCIGIALLLAAVAILAPVFSGRYQKNAMEFAKSCCTPEEAEEDFLQAQVFDQVRLGNILLWYQTGPKTGCAAVSEILWGFERIDARMMGTRRYSLYLYTADGKCHDIRTKTDKEREPLARAVAAKGYPFIYGYSQDRAGLFARDRAAFRRMAEAEVRK